MTDSHYHSCACGSLGCEDCRSQTQQSFAIAVMEAFADFQQPVLLNLIPPDSRIDDKDLQNTNLLAQTQRLRKILATGLPADCLFAGALDLSLNVFENREGYWSHHYHGVLSRKLVTSELWSLKRAFPRVPDLDVFKPIVQKRITRTELRSTAEYCYKRYFTRRSSFIANPNSRRAPYRDSRDQALSVKEDARLQAALQENGVLDPIVLIGLKRKRTSIPTEVRFMRTRK